MTRLLYTDLSVVFALESIDRELERDRDDAERLAEIAAELRRRALEAVL